MSATTSRIRCLTEAAVAPVFALILIPSFLLLAWYSPPPWLVLVTMLTLCFLLHAWFSGREGSPAGAPHTASLKAEELKDFDQQPEPVRTLLSYAFSLTAKGLSYRPGSHDPDSGGTDCSGFIYHVLQKHGHHVPRQSNEMYEWVWKAGTFRACNSVTMDTFEFADLRPGDLLFWTNSTTDGKTDRNSPVTHVMLYLGVRSATGHPVCAGASDGRTYESQVMSGVSVFDFRLPSPVSSARFIGYARVPEKPAA